MIKTSIDKTRVRGFEEISVEQKLKDFKEVLEIKLPQRATKGSAGYDIYAPFDICLEPGENIVIPTGIRAYMQTNEVLKIYPRSGLGFKYKARLANTTGIIDSDYYYSDNEGHIMIKICNEGLRNIEIKSGTAFCQGIFSNYLLADGDDFETGNTRNGGFGSTSWYKRGRYSFPLVAFNLLKREILHNE